MATEFVEKWAVKRACTEKEEQSKMFCSFTFSSEPCKCILMTQLLGFNKATLVK